MNHPLPAPHLVSLADDDQLGFMVVASLLLAGPGISNYLGWANFLGSGPLASLVQLPMTLAGLMLLFFCIRRLLRPGCRMLLRINHGGLTDFRLSDTPFQWQDILGVSRLPGFWGKILPVALLEIEPSRLPPPEKTFWYGLTHFPLQQKKLSHLLIFCGSLDRPTQDVVETIQAHLDRKE